MAMPPDFNSEAEARLEQLELDERSLEFERELEGEPDAGAQKEGLLERIKEKLHPAHDEG